MSKYKYYFRKPRSEIVKDIFKILAVSGIVYVAASSPYFVFGLMKTLKKLKKYKKKRVYDAFYNLKRKGYIKITKKNHQIYISLTEKGRKKAGWMQIDELKIKKPKKWDRKWRVVVFDISQLKRTWREAFRGKLKELGLFPIQKSVWVTPFDCKDEINLLKDFFGFSEKEIRLIVAESIDQDDKIKEKFSI